MAAPDTAAPDWSVTIPDKIADTCAEPNGTHKPSSNNTNIRRHAVREACQITAFKAGDSRTAKGYGQGKTRVLRITLVPPEEVLGRES
jgi:hypothetical protein